MQAWSKSLSTLSLTEEPKPSKVLLWLWVILFLRTTSPNCVMVFWSMTFIGTIKPFGIWVATQRRRSRLYPCITSSSRNFVMNLLFVLTPLWFPSASTLQRSFFRSEDSSDNRGKFIPLLRILFRRYHSGWRWNNRSRRDVGLNSDQYFNGDLLLWVLARPRWSYSERIFQLCFAASSDVSNLKRAGCNEGDVYPRISVMIVNGFLGH